MSIIILSVSKSKTISLIQLLLTVYWYLTISVALDFTGFIRLRWRQTLPLRQMLPSFSVISIHTSLEGNYNQLISLERKGSVLSVYSRYSCDAVSVLTQQTWHSSSSNVQFLWQNLLACSVCQSYDVKIFLIVCLQSSTIPFEQFHLPV